MNVVRHVVFIELDASKGSVETAKSQLEQFLEERLSGKYLAFHWLGVCAPQADLAPYQSFSFFIDFETMRERDEYLTLAAHMIIPAIKRDVSGMPSVTTFDHWHEKEKSEDLLAQYARPEISGYALYSKDTNQKIVFIKARSSFPEFFEANRSISLQPTRGLTLFSHPHPIAPPSFSLVPNVALTEGWKKAPR